MIALLATLSQFVIPAGFMPHITGAGKVALVICSGIGEKTIFIDAAGSGSDQTPASSHSGDTCPYFLAQGGANLPTLSIPPLVLAFISAEPRVTYFVEPPQVRFHLPEARGSPFFA